MFCSSVFFFKQKTAYEMRISDWSSDVCSSDLDYQGKLEAGYAQGDSWTISGRLSGPIIDDKLLFVASAAYANSDGRIHNVFLDKTVDGEERINLRGKLRFIPAPNLTEIGRAHV